MVAVGRARRRDHDVADAGGDAGVEHVLRADDVDLVLEVAVRLRPGVTMAARWTTVSMRCSRSSASSGARSRMSAAADDARHAALGGSSRTSRHTTAAMPRPASAPTTLAAEVAAAAGDEHALRRHAAASVGPAPIGPRMRRQPRREPGFDPLARSPSSRRIHAAPRGRAPHPEGSTRPAAKICQMPHQAVTMAMPPEAAEEVEDQHQVRRPEFWIPVSNETAGSRARAGRQTTRQAVAAGQRECVVHEHDDDDKRPYCRKKPQFSASAASTKPISDEREVAHRPVDLLRQRFVAVRDEHARGEWQREDQRQVEQHVQRVERRTSAAAFICRSSEARSRR